MVITHAVFPSLGSDLNLPDEVAAAVIQQSTETHTYIHTHITQAQASMRSIAESVVKRDELMIAFAEERVVGGHRLYHYFP